MANKTIGQIDSLTTNKNSSFAIFNGLTPETGEITNGATGRTTLQQILNTAIDIDESEISIIEAVGNLASTVSGLNTHEADDLIKAGMYGLPLWKRNFPNSYAGQLVGGATERIGNCMMRVRAERLANAFAAYKKSDILEWNEICNTYYAE